MVRRFPLTFEEFQRAFDELFDAMLIERWHAVSPAEGGSVGTVAQDLGDRYELRIETGAVDAERIDIEATERHLRVRFPDETGGVAESSFSFSEPVDRTAVTARLADGVLTVVLPKKERRQRIRVAKS